MELTSKKLNQYKSKHKNPTYPPPSSESSSVFNSSNPMNRSSLSSSMDGYELRQSSFAITDGKYANMVEYDTADPSCLGPLDVLHCCPSKSQAKDPSLRHRMGICLFAISLMWLSSLRMCVNIVSSNIANPPLEKVFDNCDDAYDLSKQEKTDFVECVSTQLNQCNNNLQSASDAESERVVAAKDANSLLMQQARTLQTSCSSAYSNSRFALETWVDKNVGGLPFLSSCSVEKRQEIADTVGDVSAVKSEAFSLSAEYSAESSSTVNRLANYAKLRAIYDANYLDNRTQHMQDDFQAWVNNIYLPKLQLNTTFSALFPGLENMASCVTPRNPSNGTCPWMKSAYELLQEQRQQMQNVIDYSKLRVDDFVDKTGEYKENVLGAVQNSREFYEGVKEAVASASIDTSGWGDWYNIDLSDVVPVDVTFPGALPTFPPVASLDSVWASVDEAFKEFQLNLTDASLATNRLAEEWRQEINEQLAQLPDPTPADYDPPQYVGGDGVKNITSEQKRHKSKTDRFLEKSAVALDAFAELSQFEEDAFTPPSFNFNFSDFEDRSSDFTFNFEELKGSTIDMNLWLIQLGSISSMLYIADFAFRAYQSVRLLYYYWGRGALNFPDIDVTADKEPKNPLKMSTPRLTALLLSTPATPALLFLVFVVWGGALMSSVYVPIYDEYQSGCVNDGVNGTFVTSNIYSIAYNYASQDGNEATFEGLDNYDVQRGEICSQYGTTTVNTQNEDEAILASLKATHAETAIKNLNFATCVDATALDSAFEAACCGQTGYRQCAAGEPVGVCPINEVVTPNVPYGKPSTYFFEDACQTTMTGEDYNLENAIYSCDALPICTMTCGGPNKKTMNFVTKKCGCTAEWFGHSIWLQMTLAFTIYVLLNMSRIGFVRGLSRFLVKYLHPGLFTYKGTCDRDGKLILGEEFAENKGGDDRKGGGDVEDPRGSKSFARVLKENLVELIPKFRRLGIPLMIAALCLNIPWIWLLNNVSKNVALV